MAKVKKIVGSVILGAGSAFLLVVLLMELITFPLSTGNIIVDILTPASVIICLVSLFVFSVLWNIITSKHVYKLLFGLLVGLGGWAVGEMEQDRIARLRWDARSQERAEQAAQARTEREVREQAQRVQTEAERQARIDAMDTVMYVNAWYGLQVWDRTASSGRRSLGTVPYRAEVNISSDRGQRSWVGTSMVAYIAWQDIQGWVTYNQLTETIEFGSLQGYWEEEASGDVWRFESDGNFAIRWGRWGSARGTYERTGNNQITFTFAHHHGLENLLGVHFESSFRRRFSMEAELFVVDEDKRILRLSNRVVSIW